MNGDGAGEGPIMKIIFFEDLNFFEDNTDMLVLIRSHKKIMQHVFLSTLSAFPMSLHRIGMR